VLYPAYATYKTLVVPKRAAASGSPRSPPPPSSAASVHSLAGERWLKYWALFGLTVVAERMLDTHLDRWGGGTAAGGGGGGVCVCGGGGGGGRNRNCR